MILAIIYLVIFGWIIYNHSFFKDKVLSYRIIFCILSLKIIACLAYYWIYFCYYPKGFNGDSVSTLKDAEVMFSALPEHPLDYIKMLLGFHSESELDPLYNMYFKHIDKWGRADVSSNFFLNDNRTPIRINAFIRLFSFGYYAVHALCMLVFSFIGQVALYKTFKPFFKQKELFLILIIFLTPSILFWTSGVLKEPIAFGLMGIFSYTFMKLFVERKYLGKYISWFIISTATFLILKPYILILLITPLLLFLLVYQLKITTPLKTIILYISTYCVVSLIIVGGLKFVFQKDVFETIVIRQNDFINLSRGGTFFLNDDKYIRFEYGDTSQYNLIDSEKQLFQMKPHAKFMYWNSHRLNDTIFEPDNHDTALFHFISSCSPSGSTIYTPRLEYSFSSFIKMIPIAFTNVLARPFFIDSHSFLEMIASFENLLYLLFFAFCFKYRSKEKININFLCLCISIVLTSFSLVGYTTTVMGAIVRYKTPFIIFLLMIPLLYLDMNKLKSIRILKPFLKSKLCSRNCNES